MFEVKKLLNIANWWWECLKLATILAILTRSSITFEIRWAGVEKHSISDNYEGVMRREFHNRISKVLTLTLTICQGKCKPCTNPPASRVNDLIEELYFQRSWWSFYQLWTGTMHPKPDLTVRKLHQFLFSKWLSTDYHMTVITAQSGKATCLLIWVWNVPFW